MVRSTAGADLFHGEWWRELLWRGMDWIRRFVLLEKVWRSTHVKIEDNRTRAEILTISEAVHRYAVEISPHACDDMSDPTCPCSSPLSLWFSFGRMWI